MNIDEEYREQLIARLKENTIYDEKTGCWIWKLSNQHGYGVISIKGDMHKVHRISYELFVGPVKEGAVIHHKCANSLCFKPKHLQCTTHTQNTAEMMQRQWYIKRIKQLEEEIKLLKDS